ncbi:MAG: hypothetical protein HZB39_20490 [Planctomycetes bacterium]|nr:hypothetical protein [Planctomycetota bacterium]
MTRRVPLAAALAILAAVPAQEVAVPAPVFETVLWLHGGPTRDAAFFAQLRKLGFTAVSVTNGEDPALPGRFGLRFYRDQCAGKGELELRDAQWRAWFDGYLAQRDPSTLVRPSCLADPTTRERVVAATAAALEAALPHGPLAASIADEASSTSHINPLDGCMSASFRTAFRAQLRARFAGDVRSLNARWGTDYVAFDPIEPWSTAAILRREVLGDDLPRNLAPWSDQLEFTDTLFVELVDAALARAGQIAPGVPVGLTGMQAPSAFGGHDYRRLMARQTFFETYDIGGARALAAAMAAPGAREFTTLFPPQGIVDARLVRGQLAAALAHGLSGVIVWSAGDVVLADGAPSPFGVALSDAFSASRPIAAAVAGARLEPSDVCIVESAPSVRVQWLLDAIEDGDTWPRRLSSHEAEHGTSLRARASWIAVLRDLGLQPDFVFAQDLHERLGIAPPRVLVLGATLALADAEAAAIVRFVEAGGTVVADHGTGMWNEALHRRDRGALDDLFGIRERSRNRSDWLVRDARGRDGHRTHGGVAIAERGLRAALGEPLDTADVQVEARRGEGRATFLNLAVCEYEDARLDESRFPLARELRSRVRQVLAAAGVVPPVLVRGDGLPACIERVVLRARDGRRLLAIRVDALARPELLARLDVDGGPLVELVFAEDVILTDLRDGTASAKGRSVQVQLPPFGGLFFAVERPR